MAKVNGKDVVIQINYGGTYQPIGCGRSLTFDIQNEFIETSVTGTGRFRTYIPSAATFSGSIEGFVFLEVPFTTTLTMEYFYLQALTGSIFQVKYYEADTTNTTYLQKEFYCYVESITETASFDNMNTFTVNFKGTDVPTITSGNV